MKAILFGALFFIIIHLIIANTNTSVYNTIVYLLFVGFVGYELVKKLIMQQHANKHDAADKKDHQGITSVFYLVIILLFFVYMLVKNLYTK